MTHLVVGAGVSGYGAAAFFASKNQPVRVSEHKTLAKAQRDRFRVLGAELCDGGHHESHLDGVTQVVVSPGVPYHHPLLAAARKQHIAVISEIDLALREFNGVLIAVTGTNGKSTTCAMLGHALRRLGKQVSVGGNYGDPPTLMLAENRMGEILVLELSSYQLEDSQLVAPSVAIFTSFSQDHLARHGTMSAYLAAKWRIFSRLPKGALCLIPADIYHQAKTYGLTLAEDEVTLCTDAHSLRSLAPDVMTQPQNRLNAGFALAATRHITKAAVSSAILEDFVGLPHRCERLGSIDGAPVINDSKSTNVESTLVALASQTAPVILLMGGQGKGEAYAPILTAQDKIKKVVTFGASGSVIAQELRPYLLVEEFSTLADALAQIGSIISGQDCGVLFSPGCASFDEFSNYEERGAYFTQHLRPYLS